MLYYSILCFLYFFSYINNPYYYYDMQFMCMQTTICGVQHMKNYKSHKK